MEGDIVLTLPPILSCDGICISWFLTLGCHCTPGWCRPPSIENGWECVNFSIGWKSIWFFFYFCLSILKPGAFAARLHPFNFFWVSFLVVLSNPSKTLKIGEINQNRENKNMLSYLNQSYHCCDCSCSDRIAHQRTSLHARGFLSFQIL